MKNIVKSILCITLISTNAFAEHVIGANVGYGNQTFKLNKTTNDGDAFNIDAYYRYMLTPFAGLEGGWTSSMGGIGSIIVGEFSEIKDASFSGPKASLFLQYPLINNNYIYTKLGVNKYTVDYTINDVSNDESKVGFEASLGFESRFSSGFGINVEYRNINNEIIKANQFMLGASYKF
ncbi:porin family protein [Aliivibrio sp. S3MY1]|uniref:porin family protein n=1 Tax=unclassified Aliivibrio TaxID=2645654 RepID=UPI002378074B|nr:MULTISPECIES: porin family protein [unclassified Aliivibrio]MDD9196802.1 porin family protein [Aliivibrio sp. S3MY1]MDD9200168.1 porin family protein [Aliivibrio sp. S2MY1]